MINSASSSSNSSSDSIEVILDSSEVDKQAVNNKKLRELIKIEHSHPDTEDPNLQGKIYEKREFYYHRNPLRPDMANYDVMANYRELKCKPTTFSLLPQQAFLSNFINPNTPYRGVLVFAGTGTGKSTCAVAIAEQFKDQVQKYGTKIYVLVPGPIVKENWKDEILQATGETYMKTQDGTIYLNDQEKQKAKKNAIGVMLQYYRFISYRSFYKKVLGEKIIEKVKTPDNKVKITYRKNEEGEFERELSLDRIYNLNNSLIIIDEAHNLTGNAYGNALLKVIKNSHNLKVVLLTATPMKNLADDIIELMNFLRPPEDPLLRDKIFTSHKNHEMTLKPKGADYLRRMTRGYVSYLRGADPLTFAKRVDMGKVANGLIFTKVVSCKMSTFQLNTYNEAISISDDTLDRRSEAVANFAFPGLNDSKQLVGYYGREGIVTVRNQLKNNAELINNKIAIEILGNEKLANDTSLLTISDSGHTLNGNILKADNLQHFSTKFYTALKKINRLVWGKKGAKTAFVYSNLVKVGIEIFQEVLQANGYLEYDENPSNYKIKGTTICHFCGKTYSEHNIARRGGNNNGGRIASNILKDVGVEDGSESSSEYESPTGEIPQHEFRPATFVVVTGKSSEESADVIPEEKQYILKNVFSNVNNMDGKFIKLVLGSKVMNEGLSLKFVAEVHILDVYFNLGKVDQSIGRAIRHCSHYEIMTKQNPFPVVKIYKYAVSIDQGLSTEEELYQKAEQKFLLINKVERILKENAIDCPLNRTGNIFPEELEKFKDCYEPDQPNNGNEMCPALCDFTNCNFKCADPKLNEMYFDEKTNMYRPLSKKELDYSTFTQSLARSEIDTAKNKIKELYRIKHAYTLKDIVSYVRNSYTGEKRELFDNFFVFEAINELTPLTENDFNNFKDTIFDKFNRQGYIIHVGEYYIFQPYDQNENVPMYYRSIFDKPQQTQLSLYNYLKNIAKLPTTNTSGDTDEITNMPFSVYNFNNVMEYYNNRKEYSIVGIIDKEPSRRKVKNIDELADVFKIREERPSNHPKKRDIGLVSLFGSVCATSKDKKYLIQLAKKLGVEPASTRASICEAIRDKLLFMEKYSTTKKGNKFTYVMIPENHPLYKFPYNLEDRKDKLINDIREKIRFKIDINVKENKIKVQGENVSTYKIDIPNNKDLEEFAEFIKSLGFKLEKKHWVIDVE